MSSQKVENWLKNTDSENSVEGYLFDLNNKLKTIQNTAEFADDLKKYTALGNSIRLSIYKILQQQNLCTCVLAELFDIKEGTISHHLKILENAGLIFGLKRGFYTVYHTKKNIIEALDR
ncbi:MAG: winged helix-turn-helix transcriptional regulator [Candidatus Lokiarchaeota archaeon]|nr:winged helix-turn-helix transcriptional regulator [Candidatus Lokiarchaeota archaeon]